MLIPVTRVDCPKCRSAGLVFAFKYYCGQDRCLCCRCGVVWNIAPPPVNITKVDTAMTPRASQPGDSSPVVRSADEGRRPRVSEEGLLARAPLEQMLRGMSEQPPPRLPYVVPTAHPGELRCTSTVVGTYIHTSCQQR